MRFTRQLVYVLQVLAVIPVGLAASVITTWVWLVPAMLRKQSPLSAGDLTIIIGILAAAYAVVLALIGIVNRRPPFSTWRRALIEGVATLVATSLGSSAVFALTDVPFSANYFAWVYALALVPCVVFFLLFHEGSEDNSWRTPLKTLLGVGFHPLTLASGLIVLLPGFLAGLYKFDRDFANSVNDLRANLVYGGGKQMTLAPAFPGRQFEQPMYLEFAPRTDNEFYILTRTGKFMRYTTEPEWREDVLVDLTSEVNGVDLEMGAQGFALHPEFGAPGSPNAGFAYLYFTSVSEQGQFNRLARFDVTKATQQEREASRLDLMDLKRPNSSMHNGGTVLFGSDGFVYIGIGDYNDPDVNQDLGGRLQAGVFRIDVDMQGGDVSAPIKRQPVDGVTANYFIPKDNPWFGRAGTLEEHWAIGFRNPFRMTFDPQTQQIWLGDVGWNSFEEQNRVSAGDNGDWPYLEAYKRTPYDMPPPSIGRRIKPLFHYEQTGLKRAAVGGVVYRGDRYPSLRDRYVFADNQAATIYAVDPDDAYATERTVARANQYGQMGITSVVEHDGVIYMTLLGSKERPSGEILRLGSSDEAAPEADPAVADDGAAGGLVAAAERAETKYLSVCYRCHGDGGRGTEFLAELGFEELSFAEPAWQNRVTDAYLKRIVRGGGAAVGRSELMPAWGDYFADDELDALIALLRSFGDDGATGHASDAD